VVRAYLKYCDINVILVDWGSGARDINYVAVRRLVPTVADYCARVLNFLLDIGYINKNITLVGHSFGAHIFGLAAAKMNVKPQNVIGLDPAKPLFSIKKADERINADCGEFVMILHTCGGTLAFKEPLGKVDVYINSGMAPQPGLAWDLLTIESHYRVSYVYADTLNTPNTFIADKCKTIKNGKCDVESSGHVIGGYPINQPPNGIYHLTTNSKSPYGTSGDNTPTSHDSLLTDLYYPVFRLLFNLLA